MSPCLQRFKLKGLPQGLHVQLKIKHLPQGHEPLYYSMQFFFALCKYLLNVL